MASKLAMMRFRDKLKSSREKNTPAAPELVAGGMVRAERLTSGRAGRGKATGGAQNSEGTRGMISPDFISVSVCFVVSSMRICCFSVDFPLFSLAGRFPIGLSRTWPAAGKQILLDVAGSLSSFGLFLFRLSSPARYQDEFGRLSLRFGQANGFALSEAPSRVSDD
jgi:hypothetical protein